MQCLWQDAGVLLLPSDLSSSQQTGGLYHSIIYSVLCGQVGLLVEHRSLYATYGKVHGKFADNPHADK